MSAAHLAQPEIGSGEVAGEVSPLTISPRAVVYVILKAQEIDAKDEASEPDPASNPSDDRMIEVLEDNADDASSEELEGFINSLSEDEQIDLVTLAWLGRDDYSAEDWQDVSHEFCLVDQVLSSPRPCRRSHSFEWQDGQAEHQLWLCHPARLVGTAVRP